MMRKILFVLVFIVTLSGCQAKIYETDELNFTNDGENYGLDTKNAPDSYQQFVSDLDALDGELNQKTKVAVLTSSTANIVSALNMNVVAVTKSDNLDDNLKSGLENDSITDLGNPMSPNLEQLKQVQPDVVFIGSNMPKQDSYDEIDNVVYVPQDYYADIFYSCYALITEFNLSNEAHNKFNELVTTDQKAKELAKNQSLENTAALKFAYGDVTIAPDNTYVGSLLTELNIDNMYGDLKDIDIPMSKEKLLLDDPDSIILYAKGDDFDEYLSNLKTDKDLQNLTAYKNNQIYILKSISLSTDIDSPTSLFDLAKEVYGKKD